MPRKDNRRAILCSGLLAFLIIIVLLIVIIYLATRTGKPFICREDTSNMITTEQFGQLDGQDVTRYILKNKNNIEVKIINYGGIITSIIVPDKKGNFDDINLGYDDMEGYKTNPPYLGAIIGRYANRIANGKFEIDGKSYQLAINNGNNSLHGGIKGFDKRMWSPSVDGDTLTLQYTSEDMEEGFPGKVHAMVKYRLTDGNELVIDYTATATKETVINLTNHAYLNLAGHGSGDISNHVAKINSGLYLPVNKNTIPEGGETDVTGTDMDLREPKRLGDMLKVMSDKDPQDVGYDHNYCFGKTGWRKPMARIEDPNSGRFVEVSSTEPGMQFYTAYWLDVPNGKGGAKYEKFGAFCLETQHYPDSPNQKNFPTPFLAPGETFLSTTWYKFGVAS